MCGIIAVLARPSRRLAPSPDEVLAALGHATELVGRAEHGAPQAVADLADVLTAADERLRGVPGLLALRGAPGLADAVVERVTAVEDGLARVEADLDAGRVELAGFDVEAVNAALVRAKDGAWAIHRDRLRTAAAVDSLVDPGASDAGVAVAWAVQVALSALDRLEVRGRDSAGLHLLLTGHGLDLDAPDVRALLDSRVEDALFTSMAARTPLGHLSLVYKAAAEIGELGDNGKALRGAIAGDPLLRRALGADTVEVTVLGHTRWASVGIISEANAHPLNSEEAGKDAPHYVTAALNGDVDNYLSLREAAGLAIPPEVTTDAKVIPTLMARRLAEGEAPDAAFRATVAAFDGSVAITASTAQDPGRLLLALRGSGQALYVGLADDTFVVASEPYGVVEEASTYLRMDGEATGGQVVSLERAHAGDVGGIRRYAYDGRVLPVGPDDLHRAEITTRDIDRAGAPHFFVKEVSEAPRSFRKTLRGRIVEGGDGRLSVVLGDDVLPAALRRRLGQGGIRRVRVVGQGTAAVAAQSLAAVLEPLVSGADGLSVAALPATELSGFRLDDDMSDTLVVAVSQSGTTTDVNRTVDLVRARGAAVVAIVNRRGSDLAEKADGVLYTSDGRDVEMSVASTKAFYAQVAAGVLLALAVAAEAGHVNRKRTDELLRGLRELPDAMQQVVAARPAIAEAAALAPARRHWAVVGNGANAVAAHEVRIKLSELCYKSIACDATEDKKHIDLSSEPLIVVCAAGLSGPTADDVGKELAIYRAHKAAPVVIATEGTAFPAALATITVPAVRPELAFVLSAMAGHLFGYEAALAIDAQARSLREARAEIEELVTEPGASADPLALLDRLAPRLAAAVAPFHAGLRAGAYNGCLEASTAVRLVTLLRYATQVLPLEAYETDFGVVGTPGVVIDDLTAALTAAIEELTRPVDAIKHQAKTVTVGISRAEDSMLEVPLVAEVLATGARRERLSFRALRTLAALDPAVTAVEGWTRYAVEGDVAARTAVLSVLDQGGTARGLRSRTADQPLLRGTKHRAADEREVTVATGASDGRTLVIVPEVKDNAVTGITLLHARFADRLAAPQMRDVLGGYRTRLDALVDAVTETEPVFDESLLCEIPVIDLLTQPVHVLAERWRAAT